MAADDCFCHNWVCCLHHGHFGGPGMSIPDAVQPLEMEHSSTKTLENVLMSREIGV